MIQSYKPNVYSNIVKKKKKKKIVYACILLHIKVKIREKWT